MASANQSLDGNSNSDSLTRNFSLSNNERNRSAHSNQEQENSPRDYDGLKQQCDMAMHELQLLRRQQNDTIRRCELTMKELEYYRGQHHAAMTQLEATTQESSSLRSKYTELVSDKQRLDREVSELRCNQQIAQQDVIVPETNNGDSINQHYITALKKYDAMKEEYDALRKRYDDLIASHSSAVDKLELTQEELGRLKTQCEEMVKERNVAVRERNGLKQQCTAAIRQWDNALRELNECQEALGKVQQQHEEAMKEINQAMAVRIKASKDLKRLTEERNAAMQEYSLIMSERDTVHKEMEKLSEDLTQAFKKNKALEMESKESMEEKKALSYHIETLKREIASALHDRDKALKECNDLREKFGEFTAKEDSQREAFKARFDSNYIRGERDAGRKDPRELQTASMDLFGQKERMDNLDQANQEIERLRKHADKLQVELQESIQEAEVSKRRRDWAFSERDKIVLERESIRTLCDRLRKERDRAVSELAEALRDSDDIKKQRNEKTKELKVLKEKMEAQMEKETRMLQYAASHSYSHDSAIDTDLQEWDNEMINIDLSGLGSNEDLGLELVGGRDDPHYPNDSGIYVSSVHKNSIAEGKLKPNDCIVRVNNLDCSSVSKRMVLETMRANGGTAVIVIRRRRVGARCLFTTQLQVNNYDHGLSLETGIYISKISPGSLAAKESNIAVGDRVLSINNKTMDGLKSCRDAMSMLNEPCDVLTLTTLRSSTSGSSGAVAGEAVGGGSIGGSSGVGGGGGGPRKTCNASTQTEQRERERERERGERERERERESLSRMTPTTTVFPPRVVAKWGGGGGSAAAEAAAAAVKHSSGGSSSSSSSKRNSSFVSSDDQELRDEQEIAIAELDSVIDSHHSHPTQHSMRIGGTTQRRSQASSVAKHLEKNGGTWPKTRSGPVIEHATGTIVHPRKNKERLPLSFLLNNLPPGYSHTQLQLPPCCSAAAAAAGEREREREREQSARRSVHLVGGGAPTDPNSIDLSVKSGNIGKEVLEYYVKKKTHKTYHHGDGGSDTSSGGGGGSAVGGGGGDPTTPTATSHPHSHPHTSHPHPHPHPHNNRSSIIVHSQLYPGHPHSGAPPPFHPVHHTHSHSSAAGSGARRYPSPSHSPTSAPLALTRSSGDSISMSLSDSRSYSFEPPYSPVSQVHHTHSPSVDSTQSLSSTSHYHGSGKDRDRDRERPGSFAGLGGGSGQPHSGSHSGTATHLHQSHSSHGGHGGQSSSHFRPPPSMAPHGSADHDLPTHDHAYHTFEGGTFPRKKENQRFRIPSNPSVASKSSGGKVSTGSIEKSSERGSPMPTFHVEVLSPGLRQKKRNSLPDYCWSQKPLPGELRRVHIDKSVEPLGIQISCLESGGVFVSTVSEHSLASQVGLQVGDQLLEVCGINMRSATYQLAANVLRQCGNSITMLVQYSPEKYHELEGTASSSSGGSCTRSGSPTPCNSPRANRKSSPLELTHSQIAQAISTLSRQKPSERVVDDVDSKSSSLALHQQLEPRYLLIETRKCSNLGISLVGGNAVGIYVHTVQPQSLAYNAGLRTGDRILHYNGTDLSQATAEEAAYELAKPADKVTVLAQYNLDRYNEVKDKPGDSFYIRALFDRPMSGGSGGDGGSGGGGGGVANDALQLRFRKDDVLYVDNTMFNGVPGNWRAWLLDEDGCRQQCGIIPSKYKVEEELLLRRSLGDLEADARRATRRSFFRRKKHQRSDSKELASFSNITLGWYSDSGPLNEETTLASYQRVTRLNCDPVFRPVLVVGPLADCVCDKLIQDFPDKFVRCVPEVMHCSQATMEKGIADSLFVDYRKKGTFYECTSVSAVKDMCDKNGHCIIDVGLASVERLHRHQIYPIVLLIKFKSTKQIKEVKDTRYSLDKVTAKIAKEMYEHTAKLESEYRHYISAVIPAGVNLAYMCTQIKAAVDLEQSKTLWVPCTNA